MHRDRLAHLGLHLEHDQAAGVDVRRHLHQRPVSMYSGTYHSDSWYSRRGRCRWVIGMRLPTLIVAFWLSSAATCGLLIIFAVP